MMGTEFLLPIDMGSVSVVPKEPYLEGKQSLKHLDF